MGSVATEVRRKQKQRIALTAVLFVILISAAGISVVVSNATIPDLNAGIERINVDYLHIWNGSDRVLWRSGVINATSDQDIRIYFWVNASQYDELKFVEFYYFNGTHDEYYNSSGFLQQGLWNYDQWWTDQMYYSFDEFNTTDSSQERGFWIPAQNGGTVVIFQLALGVWNGTSIEFTNHNSTFSVLYSDYEVNMEQEIHIMTGVYWGISFILISFSVLIGGYLILPEVSPDETPPGFVDDGAYSPDSDFLVARSNHLDSNRNSLRTGASILLTLGASSTIWISGVPVPLQSFLFLGLLALAFCAFLGIIFSFSTPDIRSGGFQLEQSLLPSGQSISHYRQQLEEYVKKQTATIESIEAAIGIGLVYFAASVVVGTFLSLLPNPSPLFQHPMIINPFWVSMAILLIDGLLVSYLAFGPKGMELIRFEFKRDES